MRSAFRFVGLTSELQTSCVIDSFSLHHSVCWSRNNMSIKIKETALCNRVSRNKRLIKLNPHQQSPQHWGAKIDLTPHPRQVLTMTSIPAQNNLLNPTTLTIFFHCLINKPTHFMNLYFMFYLKHYCAHWHIYLRLNQIIINN